VTGALSFDYAEVFSFLIHRRHAQFDFFVQKKSFVALPLEGDGELISVIVRHRDGVANHDGLACRQIIAPISQDFALVIKRSLKTANIVA